MNLQETFQKFSADKHVHHFGDFYEQFLGPRKDSVRRLLEIGVAFGNSLRAWQDYFPNARIFGIDHAPEKCFFEGRITCFVGNQDHRESLREAHAAVGGDLDVVIDDGGHRINQQVKTLAEFFPSVVPGGVFIIEDLHASFSPDYGLLADGSNSIYKMLTTFQEKGTFAHGCLEPSDVEYLQEHVLSCHIFSRRTGHGKAGRGKGKAMSLAAVLIKKGVPNV